MTPAERAQIIAGSKETALKFVSAVNTRSAHQVRQLTNRMTWEELAALAITLAPAVDPGKLRGVVEDLDDGMPEHVSARGGVRAA